MKVNDIIKEGLYDYITQRSATQQQASSQQQDRIAAQNAAQTVAAQKQAVGQFKPNSTRVAATPAPAPATTDRVELTPGVRVVKAVDPIILSYNNKNYTRQPNGVWTKLGQTKGVDPSMQQFLQSELEKL